MLDAEDRVAETFHDTLQLIQSFELVFTIGLRIGSMVPPGLASNGCTDNESNRYTSGQNADGEVQVLVLWMSWPLACSCRESCCSISMRRSFSAAVWAK